MDAPQYPTEPTPLCGRADDLTALRQLSRERRLVAITGPPGVGKSRVALALAREEAAWFCDLAPASDAESLLGHVARALGMNASGADVGAALKSRLDDLGDITLVLDNAEQVADAVAEHVAAWLDAAPAATCSATEIGRAHV